MPRPFLVNVRCDSSLAGGTVILPAQIHETTKLAPGQKIDISFGKRKIAAAVTRGETAGEKTEPLPQVILAENIRQKLLLPAPVTLNLLFDESRQCLRLGPLIGILGNRRTKSHKLFGEQTSFFAGLGSAARKMNAIAFAFAPQDIDWDNETIRGSIPPEPGAQEWRTVTLPFPDAIYDRGLFPKGEKRKQAAQARKILRRYPGISYYNPGFFGKWKTHQLLVKHELLHKHLPETCLYTSVNDVCKLLTRHRTVYIKPSGGSSGRGIIRVSSTPKGYALTFRAAKKVRVIEGLTQTGLEKYLGQLMSGQRYVVQQGLELARVQDSLFDIRVLMQRDRYGKWTRTGMAARVASPGSFISNIHAGGHAEKISSVLSRAFKVTEINSIVEQIRKLSALIAAWITSEYSPLFGEVAVDLGIDTEGKVWIIELNAIPGRSVFRRINAAKILSRAISRPMEYAFFVSGFSPGPGIKEQS